MATIYLAGGCFWGVEKYLASVNGVTDAQSGYANGTTESPTYREVVSGRTGHAETVKVDYDPEVAPLDFLLDLFYEAIDPTSVNRQGNDVGTQYRSGIFYSDPADLEVIEASLARLQERFERPLAIGVDPLTSFTLAEEYHQDYLDKNPGGYCHIDPALYRKAATAVSRTRPEGSTLMHDEAGNPPGVSRGECDDEDATEPSCDTEITAQVEDMVMGETMPGSGIPGYDAEEDGGG